VKVRVSVLCGFNWREATTIRNRHDKVAAIDLIVSVALKRPIAQLGGSRIESKEMAPQVLTHPGARIRLQYV